MNTMSKTAAIAAARHAVGAPVGQRTSWSVTGPYGADLSGPSTTYECDSYARALAARTRWVVRLALDMLGKTSLDDVLVAERCGGSIEAQINAVLSA